MAVASSAVALALVVGVIGTIWGGIVAGTPGVVAGIMATVVVLVFFALGQMAVQRVMANNPAMGLNVALGVYLGQILLLFILLLALRDATFFDPKVFAGTHVQTPNVHEMRGRTVHLSADRPFTLYADGDPIGELPVTVRTIPDAIRILVPAEPEPAAA